MDSIDLKIVKLLAKGLKQTEISTHFKNEGIEPNSLSSIEKRLRSIKTEHKAKSNFHLAIILIKKGII